jgi:hypothetical protein
MEAPLGGFPNKMVSYRMITVILLVSFGVYCNALFNGFAYDDTQQVLENH